MYWRFFFSSLIYLQNASSSTSRVLRLLSFSLWNNRSTEKKDRLLIWLINDKNGREYKIVLEFFLRIVIIISVNRTKNVIIF